MVDPITVNNAIHHADEIGDAVEQSGRGVATAAEGIGNGVKTGAEGVGNAAAQSREADAEVIKAKGEAMATTLNALAGLSPDAQTEFMKSGAMEKLMTSFDTPTLESSLIDVMPAAKLSAELGKSVVAASTVSEPSNWVEKVQVAPPSNLALPAKT